MALVNCPECNQEISDKAKKCIYCGKVLIEEAQHTKFCAECGKEIPIDTQECPFCGCPVEPEKPEHIVVTQISQKVRKNKKPIIIVAVVAVVAVIVGLIINFVSSSLNEDEQLAYQNAVAMQKMMRDPDSFRLYEEMFLIKRLDDDGAVECVYTIFKYGGANGYGAITTDEAIFKDGTYIMDYADGPDEDDPNYSEQLSVQLDLLLYQLVGDGDTWQRVDIDIAKIKAKMGLK